MTIAQHLVDKYGDKTHPKLGINYREAAILAGERFRDNEFTIEEFAEWVAGNSRLQHFRDRLSILIRGLNLAGRRDDIPYRFDIERIRKGVYRMRTILDATLNFELPEDLAKFLRREERELQRNIQGYPLEEATEGELYSLLNVSRGLDRSKELLLLAGKGFEQARIDSAEIIRLRNESPSLPDK